MHYWWFSTAREEPEEPRRKVLIAGEDDSERLWSPSLPKLPLGNLFGFAIAFTPIHIQVSEQLSNRCDGTFLLYKSSMEPLF